ncbi:NUDIX hydrolase [Streptomyces alkaliphilus]|uniref:NUDIX hydrolase n=1 Tax=Streptomyces alkaliphilus TaxID=1472722 RepID=UPI0034D34AF4
MSLLVDADLMDELTGAARRDGIERHVVGAVVTDDEGRVLLLRRRADEDHLPGLWELPSGRVDSGENLLDALRRVVTEETGLTVTAVEEYLGMFDYHSGGGRATRQFTFTVRVAPDGDLRLAEHDAAVRAAPDDDHPVSPEVRDLLTLHHTAAR